MWSPATEADVLRVANSLYQQAKKLYGDGDDGKNYKETGDDGENYVGAKELLSKVIDLVKTYVERCGECSAPLRALLWRSVKKCAVICFKLEWFHDAEELYRKLAGLLEKAGPEAANPVECAVALLRRATAWLENYKDYSSPNLFAKAPLAAFKEGTRMFKEFLGTENGRKRKSRIKRLHRAICAFDDGATAVTLAQSLSGILKQSESTAALSKDWIDAAADLQGLLGVQRTKRKAACVAAAGGGREDDDASVPKRPSLCDGDVTEQ